MFEEQLKVVGLVTATDVFVSGVATMTDIKVGTAISITSGGIKATNFYGDGATLSNLPTSQWTDINTGLAFTSIYAQGNCRYRYHRTITEFPSWWIT